MASIQQRSTGFQAQYRRRGYQPVSQMFKTRQDAEQWLQSVQAEVEQGIFDINRQADDTTLLQALERYEKEVTPTKKSAGKEIHRIRRWKREPLACRGLSRIRSRDMATYRDRRIHEGASNDTIRQELAVVSHLFTVAIKEWGMETLRHPLRGIRFPKPGKPRDRRIRFDEQGRSELDQVLEQIGNQELQLVIRLAVETAMRRSEILGITWSHIDLERRIIKLTNTKNGDDRFVPLTTTAKGLLEPLKPSQAGDQLLVRVRPITVTSGFHRAVMTARKAYLRRCMEDGRVPLPNHLVDLRFHDLRHEATSRLVEKGLSVMEVASITGHKTLSMLQRYTHLRPENLLARLG